MMTCTIDDAPRSGDAIFVSDWSLDALGSGLIQRFLDPAALWVPRTYEHVAIALDRSLALEASPAPEALPKGHTPPQLSTTVEFGKWSDVELTGGVRLIPIADLIVSKLRPRRRMRVLRKSLGAVAHPPLDYSSPEILRRLGAGYSIDVLRSEAAHILRQLPKGVADKFEWTSVPSDIATYLDLDETLRAEIERIIPGLDIPAAARTYFCSHLVVEALDIGGFRHAQPLDSKLTPSGLCATLLREGWSDASALYRAGFRADRYFGMSRLDVQAHYIRALRLATLGQLVHQNLVAIEILQGGLTNSHATASGMLDRVGDLRPSSRTIKMRNVSDRPTAAVKE